MIFCIFITFGNTFLFLTLYYRNNLLIFFLLALSRGFYNLSFSLHYCFIFIYSFFFFTLNSLFCLFFLYSCNFSFFLLFSNDLFSFRGFLLSFLHFILYFIRFLTFTSLSSSTYYSLSSIEVSERYLISLKAKRLIV